MTVKQESKENFQRVKTLKILKLQRSSKVKANSYSGGIGQPLMAPRLFGFNWFEVRKGKKM